MPQLVDQLFDLLAQLNGAPTVDETWAAYMGAAQSVGLTFGIGYFFRGDTWEAADTFGNSMPPGWLEHYASQGYSQHSPMVARNRERSPFEWRLSDWDGILTPRQRDWRADNVGAGVHGGLSIPDRSGGERKVIALCGSGERIDPQDKLILHFAGFETMCRMQDLGLRPPRAARTMPLSCREAECLTWVAMGKSDWEIGEILDLSEKTVNHYVERAKQKLAVGTRMQAVVLAMREQLISV